MDQYFSSIPQADRLTSQHSIYFDFSDISLARLRAELVHDAGVLRRAVIAIEHQDHLFHDVVKEGQARASRIARHTALGSGCGFVLGSAAYLMQQEAHLGPVEVNVGLYVGAAAGAVYSVAQHLRKTKEDPLTIGDHSVFGSAIDKGLLGGGAAGYVYGEVSAALMKHPYVPIAFPVALATAGWGIGHFTARMKPRNPAYTTTEQKAFRMLSKIVEQGQRMNTEGAVPSLLTSQLPKLQDTLQGYDNQIQHFDERIAYRRVTPIIDRTLVALKQVPWTQDSYYRRAVYTFINTPVEELASDNKRSEQNNLVRIFSAPLPDFSAIEQKVYHRELSYQLLVVLKEATLHTAN
jgi:hypothetical protein